MKSEGDAEAEEQSFEHSIIENNLVNELTWSLLLVLLHDCLNSNVLVDTTMETKTGKELFAF